MYMANKRSTKRRVTLAAFAVVALVVVGFAGYVLYIATHPLSNAQYGFQYYKPAELPAGFHITAKRIDISNPDGKLLGIDVELNLRTQDWVYDIMEYRVGSGDAQNTRTKLTNYSPASVGVTCRQVTSPAKQVYRLCHWIDYGRISVYQVNFIKGNTFIDTNFPGTKSSVVSVSSISTYVDSFVAANATGFPILSGGP